MVKIIKENINIVTDFIYNNFNIQLTLTCSKSTKVILEKCVKYVKSEQYKQENKVNDVVLVFLLLTLNKFGASYVEFEHVNVNWVIPFNLIQFHLFTLSISAI